MILEGAAMVTKITISLPEELLKSIEKERAITGENRSVIIRRAVELFLRQKQEQQLSRAYVRAYEAHPETEREIETSRVAATAILAGEPWS
jgi:metal-responsive CopG/Arc/MetJ family transcriptional regulator